MFDHLANLNTHQIELDGIIPVGVFAEDMAEDRVYSAFINVVDRGLSLIQSEYRLLKNVCHLRGYDARASFEDVKNNLCEQVVAVKFLLCALACDLGEIGKKYLVNPHP
jgi:hypothetical protein